MNKKAYITPSMEVMNMETVNMFAGSMGFGDGPVNSTDQLSNDRRGSWGNLWDKE
jgi:hypothetical protein